MPLFWFVCLNSLSIFNCRIPQLRRKAGVCESLGGLVETTDIMFLTLWALGGSHGLRWNNSTGKAAGVLIGLTTCSCGLFWFLLSIDQSSGLLHCGLGYGPLSTFRAKDSNSESWQRQWQAKPRTQVLFLTPCLLQTTNWVYTAAMDLDTSYKRHKRIREVITHLFSSRNSSF